MIQSINTLPPALPPEEEAAHHREMVWNLINLQRQWLAHCEVEAKYAPLRGSDPDAIYDEEFWDKYWERRETLESRLGHDWMNIPF